MSAGPTVAVLGAGGTMGLPIARNLAGAGLRVQAWNRTPEKLADLAADTAVEVAPDPAAAAAGAEVVLTVLTDAETTLERMDWLRSGASGLAPGAVWVQSATIGIEGTERCAALAGEAGIGFVDAPLLGTKAPAEAAQLVVLAAGEAELAERVEPVFAAIGRRTVWVGAAGEASRLKLAVNAWIVSLAEAVAETVALAGGLGVDPEVMLDALTGTPLDSPYLRGKARAMLAGDFEPTLSLTLAAKDAGLAAAAGRAAGLDLPLLEAVRGRFEEAARDYGESDLGATFILARGASPDSVDKSPEGS